MKAIGRTLGALGIIIVLLAANSGWAAISASLDRDRAALGDTLRLTITATDGEELGDLDLRPLNRDFEILQRSSNSKTSIINGDFSSTQELVLGIAPRREGQLFVPALQLGNLRTARLPVTVSSAPAADTGGQNLVFDAELDRTSVYVQGQVILTLRIQQAINLDDRNITQLELDDAFVRPLEQHSFQRTVNGRPWLVHEVRYAIFPEHSGTLEIPAQTFSARESAPRRSMFDLGGNGRLVRRSTQALQLEVLPKPDNYPGGEWLPARELTLEESWSTPPEQLRVGESATRTITIRGDGLQGAQLPPVLFPATEGLKYYPDQPVIGDSESPTGLVGTRVDSVAVVPTRAGKWHIPELRIPWWDTQSNEVRWAVLPGRELDVVAAGATTGSLPAAPIQVPEIAISGDGGVATGTQGGSLLWQAVAAVSGIGWLCTLLYLVATRKRQPASGVEERSPAAREAPAFKQLLTACAHNDAAQSRQALIAWAALVAGRPELASLAQVSAALGDPAMTRAVELLDGALYGTAPGGWDGAALAEAARRLRGTIKGAPPAEEVPLQLYPRGR